MSTASTNPSRTATVRTPTTGTPGGATGTPLFVIPHAGGGAHQYRGWADWLPDRVRLEALELPGHADRADEPLVTDWRPLTSELADTVRTRSGGDYLLAGHSLGALLAFEAARILEREGMRPALLLVSGRNAPASGLSHRPIHRLPDDEFLAALGRLGGIADRLAARPELLRAYLPALRADMRLAETYNRTPGPPLSAPIAVFAGRQDRLTDLPGLAGWARETTGAFDLTVIGGGHFFHAQPAFTAAVLSRLARLGPAWR